MQLGELEKQVLQYLWQNQTASAKQVHAVFERERGSALNTIQTTLDRLYKKGLLTRVKESHAFLYSPKVERHTLIAQLIKDVTHDFISGDENSLIAAFTSISSDLDIKQLDELEQLIAQQRSKLQSGAQ